MPGCLTGAEEVCRAVCWQRECIHYHGCPAQCYYLYVPYFTYDVGRNVTTYIYTTMDVNNNTIICSLIWSLGLVPDSQKCIFVTSPRYKYCSLGLVPDTKTDSLGLDIYYIYIMYILWRVLSPLVL